MLVAFVIIGAGFVAVLVDLQTVRPERYRDLGQKERTSVRRIAGDRGSIVDRNGFVLASSTPSHQIVADPTQIVDPGATGALLAPILGIEVTTLANLLTPSSADDRYSLLARDVNDATVTQLQEVKAADGKTNGLVGIYVKPEEERVYPAGGLASAVVGQVDPDQQGIFGVEKLFNDEMTGQPGTERIERGHFGSISVGDWKVDPATAGANVVLTIDYRIQYMAEQVLLAHCRATGAQKATATMSDPHSGEILAMATAVRRNGECVVPDYNAALVDNFEPGSVLKPLVVAGATQELGLTADSLIEVPGRITIGGKVFVDHPPHSLAKFPISEILAQSMNVGTIMVSKQLTAESIYNYLTGFGIGQPSGLQFPGESAVSLRRPDQWHGADYGSIPIGQGVSVNAVQLLSAYNTLANRGTFVAPTLVRPAEATDGSLHSGEVTAPRRVISEQTAAEVTRSLKAVADHGTGTEAEVPGYTVAGKTGTAWKAYDDGSGKLTYGGNGEHRYVATFAGFLPAENPQLSLVVVVDEPQTQTMAATVAAPIFSEIAAYAARVLPILPAEGAPADGSRVRGTPALDPGQLAAGKGGAKVDPASPTTGGTPTALLATGPTGGAKPPPAALIDEAATGPSTADGTAESASGPGTPAARDGSSP